MVFRYLGWLQRKNILIKGPFWRKTSLFFEDKGGVYFGSEVKFIRTLLSKKLLINYQYLNRYLVYGYKYLYNNDETFFKGLSRLNMHKYDYFKR